MRLSRLFLPLFLLVGCASTPTTTSDLRVAVETRVRNDLRDYDGVDFFRLVANKIEAVSPKLDPATIRAAMPRAIDSMTGQFASANAQKAEITLAAVLQFYSDRYRADDSAANRASLKSIVEGIRQGL